VASESIYSVEGVVTEKVKDDHDLQMGAVKGRKIRVVGPWDGTQTARRSVPVGKARW